MKSVKETYRGARRGFETERRDLDVASVQAAHNEEDLNRHDPHLVNLQHFAAMKCSEGPGRDGNENKAEG